MNCKHVEELLPLYVGRDLGEPRASLVTTHVETCPQCARSLQEYGEANRLLQRFGPPQFNEATYAALRKSVLGEIERKSSLPQSTFALEFLVRFFQPRFRWAVSTAVLLAVCVFAYYFVVNRTKAPRSTPEMAENRGDGAKNTRGAQAAAGSTTDNSPARPEPSKKGIKFQPTGTTLTARLPRPRSNTPTGLLSRRPRQLAAPLREAQYSASTEPEGFPNVSVTSEKALRLEIQTKDPNVRIIWFSHPADNHGSPNESSKGI